MFEVLGYAFNRQGFFIEGPIPDLVAPAGNPVLIPPISINLPDPPGIPVAGHTDEDV